MNVAMGIPWSAGEKLYKIKQLGSRSWVVEIKQDASFEDGLMKAGSYLFFKSHKSAAKFAQTLYKRGIAK